jgi:hypothetical protein
LRRTGRRDKSQVRAKVEVEIEIEENFKNFEDKILEKKVEIINDLSVDLWFKVIKLLGHEVDQKLKYIEYSVYTLDSFCPVFLFKFSYIS